MMFEAPPLSALITKVVPFAEFARNISREFKQTNDLPEAMGRELERVGLKPTVKYVDEQKTRASLVNGRVLVLGTHTGIGTDVFASMASMNDVMRETKPKFGVLIDQRILDALDFSGGSQYGYFAVQNVNAQNKEGAVSRIERAYDRLTRRKPNANKSDLLGALRHLKSGKNLLVFPDGGKSTKDPSKQLWDPRLSMLTNGARETIFIYTVKTNLLESIPYLSPVFAFKIGEFLSQKLITNVTYVSEPVISAGGVDELEQKYGDWKKRVDQAREEGIQNVPAFSPDMTS